MSGTSVRVCRDVENVWPPTSSIILLLSLEDVRHPHGCLHDLHGCLFCHERVAFVLDLRGLVRRAVPLHFQPELLGLFIGGSPRFSRGRFHLGEHTPIPRTPLPPVFWRSQQALGSPRH